MTQANFPYDPDLKIAAAEIKAVLEAHGIAGAVMLASPTHAEHLLSLPAWSVIHFQPDGGMRIRCQRGDYESDQAQHQAMEASAHVVMRFLDISALYFGMMDAIKETLEAAGIKIEHEAGSGYTPHRRQ